MPQFDTIHHYSDDLRRRYGRRIQKISIHLDVSCPNRLAGQPGCSYCNPESFLPPSARNGEHRSEPVRQFTAGVSRFSTKYPDQLYIAYVQGYTGTLAPIARLEDWYGQLLAQPHCVGLTVGTRPDCLGQPVIELLSTLARSSGKEVRVELGAESFDDRVLHLANRGCGNDALISALERCRTADLPTDIHLIVGLPGSAPPDMAAENIATTINALPIDMVKFHQFQLISGSYWGNVFQLSEKLADDHSASGSPAERELLTELSARSGLTVQDYSVQMMHILTHLSADIAIGRLAADGPSHMIRCHSSWNNMKNYRFSSLLEGEMKRRGLRQGMYAQ